LPAIWSRHLDKATASSSASIYLGFCSIDGVLAERFPSGFMHLAAGLSVGLTGLAAGYAIGVVGDVVC